MYAIKRKLLNCPHPRPLTSLFCPFTIQLLKSPLFDFCLIIVRPVVSCYFISSFLWTFTFVLLKIRKSLFAAPFILMPILILECNQLFVLGLTSLIVNSNKMLNINWIKKMHLIPIKWPSTDYCKNYNSKWFSFHRFKLQKTYKLIATFNQKVCFIDY